MRPDRQTVRAVMRILSKRYTERGMTDLGNPDDTIIATVLSAQTTDVQVLKAFPGFRKKFPDWKALAKAKLGDIERSINTIGLYTGKARALKGMAQRMLSDFDGKVPRTMDELLLLPGVGRKTASVVLSACFGEPSIAVDTHVFRIMTKRLAWSRGRTAEKVEADLMSLVPKERWSELNRTLVPFGRDVCKAARPQCWRCPIATYCPFTPKTPSPKG